MTDITNIIIKIDFLFLEIHFDMSKNKLVRKEWTEYSLTELEKFFKILSSSHRLKIIQYLKEHGDTRLAELQSKLNFTSYPHIKPHLDSLEKGRFIELIRDEQDKRIVMAHLKRWIDTLIFIEEESIR